jgi:MFS family permease
LVAHLLQQVQRWWVVLSLTYGSHMSSVFPYFCLVYRYNYFSYRRGQPMAFLTLAGVAAQGLGPVIAGVIEADPRLGWRWIQWIHVMSVYWNISDMAID